MNLNTRIDLVADHLEIEKRLIRSRLKERAAVRARAAICLLAADKLGMKGSEIAIKMNSTPSGVSKLAGRGRRDSLSDVIERRLLDAQLSKANVHIPTTSPC